MSVLINKMGVQPKGGTMKASPRKAAPTKAEALRALETLKGALWGTGNDIRDVVGVRVPSIASPNTRQQVDTPSRNLGVTGAQGPVSMRTGPRQDDARPPVNDDGVSAFTAQMRFDRAQRQQ